MNRLQKKCVFATAGIHMLLLLILIVGPAFFNPQPKPDNTQVLDMIPANVLDNVLNSGVRDATPPPPAPIVTPQPPQPTPPAPTPVVTPPPKPVEPTPTFLQKVEKIFKPEPAKPTPPKPAEPQTHKIQPNLTPTTRTAPKNSTPNPKPDNSKAINSALKNLKSNLAKGTTVDMPGDASVAVANYASVVRSVYDAAWTLPNTIAKDENITVKVTIASDGTVISSRIITPSGDTAADDSVQRALDRVKFIQAFPEGSTDKQRTYTINFNPQVKSSE